MVWPIRPHLFLHHTKIFDYHHHQNNDNRAYTHTHTHLFIVRF